MWVHRYLCPCIWKSEVNTGVFLCVFLFEIDSLCKPGAHCLVHWLPPIAASGILLSLPFYPAPHPPLGLQMRATRPGLY